MTATMIDETVPTPLRDVERARQQAMIAGDALALAALLHDDLVYIHSLGRRDDKQTFLDTVASGLVKYESMTVDVHSSVALGHEAWLIAGRLGAAVMVGGKPAVIDAIFTATWLRGSQGWRLTSWQSTPWPAG